MFKRFFWLSSGVALGFGGSFWIARTVKKAIQRYAPDRLAGHATKAVKSVGTELRAALGEGRVAMREREAELRAELER